jgi:hypothetical protein
VRFGFECTGESGGNSDENFWLWWLTDSGDFRVTTHARRTWGPNIIQVAFSASSSPGERVESAAWESYLELDFMRSVVVDHSIQYSRECLFRSWFLSGRVGSVFVLFWFFCGILGPLLYTSCVSALVPRLGTLDLCSSIFRSLSVASSYLLSSSVLSLPDLWENLTLLGVGRQTGVGSGFSQIELYSLFFLRRRKVPPGYTEI